MKFPAMQESVLSLAVREGVTNVVRHAQARSAACASNSRMDRAAWKFTMTVQGFATVEGNGLRGMRERVEMLGGTLERTNRVGHHAHHHSATERSGCKRREGREA